MSNKGKEIGQLLNTATAPAPDITKLLKSIGDGNMLDGVKNIFNYALIEGEKTGLATGEKRGLFKGGVITFAIFYLVPKGVNYVKTKAIERKTHKAMGEKIHVAFSEELVDNLGEEDPMDKVIETDGIEEENMQ